MFVSRCAYRATYSFFPCHMVLEASRLAATKRSICVGFKFFRPACYIWTYSVGCAIRRNLTSSLYCLSTTTNFSRSLDEGNEMKMLLQLYDELLVFCLACLAVSGKNEGIFWSYVRWCLLLENLRMLVHASKKLVNGSLLQTGFVGC